MESPRSRVYRNILAQVGVPIGRDSPGLPVTAPHAVAHLNPGKLIPLRPNLDFNARPLGQVRLGPGPGGKHRTRRRNGHERTHCEDDGQDLLARVFSTHQHLSSRRRDDRTPDQSRIQAPKQNAPRVAYPQRRGTRGAENWIQGSAWLAPVQQTKFGRSDRLTLRTSRKRPVNTFWVTRPETAPFRAKPSETVLPDEKKLPLGLILTSEVSAR
jgi:hypothetical protein